MKLGLLVLGLAISVQSFLAAQPYMADTEGARPSAVGGLHRTEDSLRKQFNDLGLEWPAKEVYIRSFKYDSQLEIWVRNSDTLPFQLFKSYKVCAMAGAMGPKRIEGDYQVPEGFYYISEFKPRSEYHMSLKLNYPNESDKILSDPAHPGGNIYIHGSCVTVGCIPVKDSQIEEIYMIAAAAKNNGQAFIPVHVFPVQFDKKKSLDYLYNNIKTDYDMMRFEVRLKEVYDFFNEKKELPLIAVNKKGEYVLLNGN